MQGNNNIIDNQSAWAGSIVLNSWKKNKHLVRVINSVGGKVEGVIKNIDKFEITLLDETTDQKFIIFKSNIFFITKLKGAYKK